MVTCRAARTQCILRGKRAPPGLTGITDSPPPPPEELLAVLGVVGCAGQWWSEQGVKLFQEDQAAHTNALLHTLLVCFSPQGCEVGMY